MRVRTDPIRSGRDGMPFATHLRATSTVGGFRMSDLGQLGNVIRRAVRERVARARDRKSINRSSIRSADAKNIVVAVNDGEPGSVSGVSARQSVIVDRDGEVHREERITRV